MRPDWTLERVRLIARTICQCLILILFLVNSIASLAGIGLSISRGLNTCLVFIAQAMRMADESALPLLLLSILWIFLSPSYKNTVTKDEAKILNFEWAVMTIIPLVGAVGIFMWYKMYASTFNMWINLGTLMVASIQYGYVCIKYSKTFGIETVYTTVIGCIWLSIITTDRNTTDLNYMATTFIGCQISVASCWAVSTLADIIDHHKNMLDRALRISMMLMIVTNPYPWFYLSKAYDQCIP